MFDFPASPTLGQPFTPVSGGPAYAWDGTAWRMTSGGVNSGVFIGDAPPANPVPGQLWWRSSSGETFIYFSDGSSSQWVQFNASAIPAAAVGTSLTFIQRQSKTSSGAITLHDDTRAFLVQVQGGGGGGGNCPNGAGAALGAAGPGGGSGSYGEKWIIRQPTTVPTCTIGAGGGSTAAGGQSSFADGTNTVTAPGGTGGGSVSTAAAHIWWSPGGASAAGTGGDVNVPGTQGDFAMGMQANSGANMLVKAGRGADSLFGSGGSAGGATTGAATQSAGNGGSGFGAGGSGGYSMNGGTAIGGGTGSSGIVIITEFK
jgi:hypothetical protein